MFRDGPCGSRRFGVACVERDVVEWKAVLRNDSSESLHLRWNASRGSSSSPMFFPEVASVEWSKLPMWAVNRPTLGGVGETWDHVDQSRAEIGQI